MNGTSMRKGGPGSRGGKVIGHTKSGKPKYAKKGGGGRIGEHITHSAEPISTHHIDKQIAEQKAHLSHLIKSNPGAAHHALLKHAVEVHGIDHVHKMLKSGLAKLLGH